MQPSASTNQAVKILVMPELPQYAFVYFKLKADNIRGLQLDLNSEEDQFSTLIRKYSDRDGIIKLASKAPDALEVCMLVGETLTFYTTKGLFELKVIRFSNPGSWREAHDRAEDITVLELSYQKG